MKFRHIIVQAGGKGTRMQELTKNKPKALVPVENLPMIFHLFRQFPDCEFVVIGDYKYDVLEKYLGVFADVRYTLVNAAGKTGTCAGLKEAVRYIPEKMPFMLIWSDLILNKDLDISDLETADYVGTSYGFRCRWKYENSKFEEIPSDTCGVAGMFIFKNKQSLSDVPEQGEFVQWLSGRNIRFQTIVLDKTKEYGLISEYNKLKKAVCRPFNRLIEGPDYIIKEGIDEQGKSLAVREKAWYQKTLDLGFKNLPHIYSIEPLKLEKINGKNIYEYGNLPAEQKKHILDEIADCLFRLHDYGETEFDEDSFYEAYIGKTFDRLNRIKDLVPFADQEKIMINGRQCKNVFFFRKELENLINRYRPSRFVFLHGDCTFSNLMLRNDKDPVLIDPRGYFGTTEYYGDAAYDYAKLYYSVVGNYDQFNKKNFSMDITDSDVRLTVGSSHWEDMEDYFFRLFSREVTAEQIKLIHAIIWLSLTTYAWEDYDSICGAFYNGLIHLEEVL